MMEVGPFGMREVRRVYKVRGQAGRRELVWEVGSVGVASFGEYRGSWSRVSNRYRDATKLVGGCQGADGLNSRSEITGD